MAFTSLERLKSAIATGARSNLFTVTLAIPDLNDNGLIEKFQYVEFRDLIFNFIQYLRFMFFF